MKNEPIPIQIIRSLNFNGIRFRSASFGDFYEDEQRTIESHTHQNTLYK